MDERPREQKRGLPGDGPAVKTLVLPLQGAWVQFLVGELRSHMLCCMAKNKKLKKNSLRDVGTEQGRKVDRVRKKSLSAQGKSDEFLAQC